MIITIQKELQSLLQSQLIKVYPMEQALSYVELEVPQDASHGDFSTNIALKSAKVLKRSPIEIAEKFIDIFNRELQKDEWKKKISRIEVKRPGFINFFLSPTYLHSIVDEVFQKKDNYGQLPVGNKEKVQVEFVSANPTGPLSVAHARQAAVGDALVNIMKFMGYDAHKEYYVNDGGNQISVLGRSIKCRAIEILTGSVDFPEEGYQGEYIKKMAQIFMDNHNVKTVDDLNACEDVLFKDFGATYLLDEIKNDLLDFGVEFDFWAYESKIANEENILAVLKVLEEKELTYEKDGALWFKTTAFGDDKDRVLKKSDGLYTYLTPDIAYHRNKFERGFDRVFNILGPDHHGYIQRIKAAAVALGKKQDDLEVLIVQLASIFRNGESVSMSTRKGEFISLREVLDEVGADAARFFFLMRHIKAHLEFDLDLAKKQSSENPVYYVQYAHARVFSVNKKAKDQGIYPKESGFSLLQEDEEFALIKKLGSFSDALLNCCKQFDPYTLVSYLQELATAYHRFYDKCRVVSDDKELSSQRLGLMNATRFVLANGLRLLGVSTPTSM